MIRQMKQKITYNYVKCEVFTMYGQPVYILKEGTERSRGKDAQRNNITAVRAVSEAIRSAQHCK